MSSILDRLFAAGMPVVEEGNTISLTFKPGTLATAEVRILPPGGAVMVAPLDPNHTVTLVVTPITLVDICSFDEATPTINAILASTAARFGDKVTVANNTVRAMAGQEAEVRAFLKAQVQLMGLA